MPRRIKESAFFSEKNFSKKDLLKQQGLYKKDDKREQILCYRQIDSVWWIVYNKKWKIVAM